MGMGKRNSEFSITNCAPPTGTRIFEQVEVSAGLLHTATVLCGPAPVRGNPRKVLPPPEENRSLSGPRPPANACQSPRRRLFGQLEPPPPPAWRSEELWHRNRGKWVFAPRTL